MEKLTSKEIILLRQMVNKYIQVLGALLEDQQDDYEEQLKICLSIQRKFDDGSEIPESSWGHCED